MLKFIITFLFALVSMASHAQTFTGADENFRGNLRHA